MFSLFQKKYHIKDFLHGFTDIHNHVLPGIDDGAVNLEASMELINGFLHLGIRELIATPHIMNDYYPNNRETIENALTNLQKELQKRDYKIRIRAAAEYIMDQSFLEYLEKDDLLCLQKNNVLVEMSYFQAPMNLREILFKLQTKQYKPVLAHPERYVFFHSKTLQKYQELKDRGCLFQLNILSLTGHYGKNIQRVAFQLLKNKMIDFIGTDVHQLRHLEKLQQATLRKNQVELLLPVIENTKREFSF